MSEAPTYAIQTFRSTDDLTDAMVSLFGNSIEDAWDMAVPEPAVIGALTPQGEMAGGIFMFFDGTGGSKVASIRQLIVRPEHWGRGIATEAIQLVSAYAFGVCNMLRLFALPFADNARSIRALEKAGYTREALLRASSVKDRKVRDQALYVLINDKWAGV